MKQFTHDGYKIVISIMLVFFPVYCNFNKLRLSVDVLNIKNVPHILIFGNYSKLWLIISWLFEINDFPRHN